MQEPQSIVRPLQPSLCAPHVPIGKSAHVLGVQSTPPSGATFGLPQTLKPPAPQVWPPGQAPQSLSGPPQPSPFKPQLKPCCSHVLGTQGFEVVLVPESWTTKVCPEPSNTDASLPVLAAPPAPPHDATVTITRPMTA